MPKIIVTSRYLKSGSKKNLVNYVKYVATREGSVAVKNIDENAPATKNQRELILSLLNDFPDIKELFEYQDYIKNPTVKNGSALISEVIDRNMDRLTNRPGSVKFNSHGLFNEKDAPIDLEKVEKEVEYISGKNFEKGIPLLTECANGGDAFACYQLGKFYFFGDDGLEKDKEKGMKYMDLCAVCTTKGINGSQLPYES